MVVNVNNLTTTNEFINNSVINKISLLWRDNPNARQIALKRRPTITKKLCPPAVSKS